MLKIIKSEIIGNNQSNLEKTKENSHLYSQNGSCYIFPQEVIYC